jgi:hypothetical protein
MTKALGRLAKADVLREPAELTPLGAIGGTLDAERVTNLFEQFHGMAPAGVCR